VPADETTLQGTEPTLRRSSESILARPSAVPPWRSTLSRVGARVSRRAPVDDSSSVPDEGHHEGGARDPAALRRRPRGRVRRSSLGVGALLGVIALGVGAVGGAIYVGGRRSAAKPSLSPGGPRSVDELPMTGESPTSAATGTAVPGVLPLVTVAAPLPTATTGPPRPTIAVHVAGAVAAPGVYVFADGARVDDVLAAAGGLQPDADGDSLNRAARVADGVRVYVPRRGQTIPPIATPDQGGAVGAPGVAGTGTVSTATVPIDLNTATAEQLDALPGVGPSTAAAIVEYRTQHGRFRSVGELLQVRGIGTAKFADLRPRVRV
jgi:competence protein ComEA